MRPLEDLRAGSSSGLSDLARPSRPLGGSRFSSSEESCPCPPRPSPPRRFRFFLAFWRRSSSSSMALLFAFICSSFRWAPPWSRGVEDQPLPDSSACASGGSSGSGSKGAAAAKTDPAAFCSGSISSSRGITAPRGFKPARFADLFFLFSSSASSISCSSSSLCCCSRACISRCFRILSMTRPAPAGAPSSSSSSFSSRSRCLRWEDLAVSTSKLLSGPIPNFWYFRKFLATGSEQPMSVTRRSILSRF
mmetsp:Transcript_96360/g.171264  ORF Transcript_96360/g.171264 Transcript_96360/m.171264 type:complete len:249 (-) Transcript_96360:104-850(-)